MKPMLLIDVDGPLNPYARSNRQLRKTTSSKSNTPPEGRFHEYKLLGLKVWLNRWHGQQLLALADVFDLVWCTTWGHQANTDIGPKIGLPKLPVIEFPATRDRPDARIHWKTTTIVAYTVAHDRPFAWIDDEVGAHDGIWFARWCRQPFMTRKIDPSVGLADEDFAALREWVEGGMHE